MITPNIAARKYIPSPKGFATWFQKDGKLILKLNLANIISSIASSSDTYMDVNIINAIIDAVSQMDAMKVKELLTTLNQSLNNETLGFLEDMQGLGFIISAFLNGISEAFLSPERIEFGLELVPNK